MHFNGFNLRFGSSRGEGDLHTWFKDTGFDSTDWDSTNTSDLVDVLEWDSEWFFSGSFWWLNEIKSFNKSGTFVPCGVG